MFRRSLTAGLFLAALTAGLASAKSPDLPLPQNDTLAPANHAEDAPLFVRVRPSVRRTMASCLLFGLNPALALAPTEEYVDFDAEDLSDMETGVVPTLFRLTTWAGEPTVNYRQCHDSQIAPAVTIDWESPRANVAVPADGSVQSVCPYMRQQQCAQDHSPMRLTEIDLSDDVLHNLEMLRQAQLLLQNARELGEGGHVCEALQCLNLVHDLCPGGWLDGRVQEAAMDVFAACYCGSSQDDAKRACEAESDAATNRTEHEIERILSQPVALNFTDVPLRQVIDDLRCGQNLHIYVDLQALDEEEVSLDQRVSIRLEEVSLRSALILILRSAHLAYVVKDGVLQITTERAARGKLIRVSYAVADLLEVVPERPVAAAGSDKHTPEETLIKLITDTINPREWSKNGGPGTIDFHPGSRTLVINQTPDVQEQVTDLLAALHRLRFPDEKEERQDGGLSAAPRSSDTESLRPAMPPVDSQVPATLDRLYDEDAPSGVVVVGAEEPEPSADVLRSVAKPFMKTADLDEVGSCKDGGAPISFVEVLKEFAAVAPPGHGELYLGLDGSVRMFTQLHRGGAVWHVLYSNGSLSVWASPDGGADASVPAETSPDDDSAH